MFDVDFTKDQVNGSFTWPSVAAGNTTKPLQLNVGSGLSGTVAFSGAFGGLVELQASLDNVNWFTISDIQDVPISYSVGGMHEFSVGAKYLRPVAQAGVTGANITVRVSSGW